MIKKAKENPDSVLHYTYESYSLPNVGGYTISTEAVLPQFCGEGPTKYTCVATDNKTGHKIKTAGIQARILFNAMAAKHHKISQAHTK